MKVLLDTGVLLDLALDRDPFSGPAGEVLDWLAAARAPGLVGARLETFALDPERPW